MVNPKKKPKFRRPLSESLKRLKSSWRKPRGIHSKTRIRKKGKLKRPSIGYGAPRELKHLHPSGFREVLVKSLKDLEKIDPKEEAIRISSKVGRKKRIEILKIAKEKNIKVLNPQV